MVNKNIIKIRKSLDKLDNNFLILLKKREKLINQVLKNKRFKKEIIDRKRIKTILKNIHKKSRDKKIDKIVTRKIWTAMINAYIDYEYRNFKKK